MNQQLTVTKRDGRKENIDLDKIHRVLDWAAEDLNNVSVSQVELRSHIQFYDGIKTEDIHETIIKAAADLISEATPDYQYLAARLAIFHLRKKAFGQFEPPRLADHVATMVDMGKYDSHLLEDYTTEELDILDSYIDHWRDMNFSYAAVKQLEGKYLVQNRVTGEIYESAQFLYMMVAACLFSGYPKETRLDYVRRFYDAVSTFKISLPTPIMLVYVHLPVSSALVYSLSVMTVWIQSTQLPAPSCVTFLSVQVLVSMQAVSAHWAAQFVVAKPSTQAVSLSTSTSRLRLSAVRKVVFAVVLPRCSTQFGTVKCNR